MRRVDEEKYTLHLREQGIDPAALTVAPNGTVATPSTKTHVSAPTPAPGHADSDPSPELGILSTLGVGGMGKVLLATQRPLQREVAVKMLKHPDTTGTFTAELMKEALVTGRLEHPNIVPVHTLGSTKEGAPYFVMKRIEGTPWKQLIDQPSSLEKFGHRADDPLGFHLGVFIEVCDAVSFAHSRGVIHRDLKPENVMLGSFGEVYVLDWGIAVTLKPDPLLSLASDSVGICGTPQYMAPEMAAGDGPSLSERTDVFLLGAVLHYVLCGKPPHQGVTVVQALAQAWESVPPEFGPQVHEELAVICRRAMARWAKDRYASVEELRDAVEKFLRRRDSLALAAEAERRLTILESSIAQKQAGTAVDPLALQVAFTECRFAYQQVRAVPGLEASAKAGLSRAVVAMARGELLDENLPAARALVSQLEVPPRELVAAIDALALAVEGRKARVAALEQLEQENDLNRAVSLRGRVALAVGVLGSAGMFLIGQLKRAGIMPFSFREAVIGMSIFCVCLVSMEVLIRLRTTLNQAQRRLLRGNRVAMVSFIVFWSGAWALDATFEQAAVAFMFCVAVNWWIVTVLYDTRGWPVPAAFTLATFASAKFTGWEIEIFAAATLLGFGGLAVTWRELSAPARRA